MLHGVHDRLYPTPHKEFLVQVGKLSYRQVEFPMCFVSPVESGLHVIMWHVSSMYREDVVSSCGINHSDRYEVGRCTRIYA